ncbi:MAG: hypothetical protein B1H05_00495 [Candidatus Cloacimonas sp. 4484_140]|nr:MAG: hypothetical protein B1H05_00495 [Candidatus Cloacimonas sp. 4484_140]
MENEKWKIILNFERKNTEKNYNMNHEIHETHEINIITFRRIFSFKTSFSAFRLPRRPVGA